MQNAAFRTGLITHGTERPKRYDFCGFVKFYSNSSEVTTSLVPTSFERHDNTVLYFYKNGRKVFL